MRVPRLLRAPLPVPSRPQSHASNPLPLCPSPQRGTHHNAPYANPDLGHRHPLTVDPRQSPPGRPERICPKSHPPTAHSSTCATFPPLTPTNLPPIVPLQGQRISYLSPDPHLWRFPLLLETKLGNLEAFSTLSESLDEADRLPLGSVGNFALSLPPVAS